MEKVVIPEYLEDFLGRKVYPGDIIGYSVLEGRSASMSVGRILEFTISGGYSPEIKIKVQGVDKQGWGPDRGKLKNKKPGYLFGTYGRFVLLPAETLDLLPTT